MTKQALVNLEHVESCIGKIVENLSSLTPQVLRLQESTISILLKLIETDLKLIDINGSDARAIMMIKTRLVALSYSFSTPSFGTFENGELAPIEVNVQKLDYLRNLIHRSLKQIDNSYYKEALRHYEKP
jgi:hypothetical protein